jgi:diguanylate cyclase (GGDEF)-like protein
MEGVEVAMEEVLSQMQSPAVSPSVSHELTASPSSDLIQALLVEDNEDDAHLARIMLSQVAPGAFHLTHADCLKEALRSLGEMSFGVVLLDLSLPDGEGLHLISELAAVAPSVPIVVWSGRDDETLALKAVQNGAQDYLIKGQGDGHLLVRSLRYAIERKQMDERLKHMASHDVMTGLPNRLLFADRLDRAISKARRGRQIVAILYLDLDGFKAVNDTFGHLVGDRLLKAVSARLTSEVRAVDTVARLGGDEFVLVFEELEQIQDIERIVRNLLEAMRSPFYVDERELFITASIGVGLYPADGEDAETLLRNSDVAMYRAKEQGKNSYSYYSALVHDRVSTQMSMEANLRNALRRSEFSLQYQPQRKLLLPGPIESVEALLRWHPARMAEIPPSEFIPMAEEGGMILQIGEWVLRAACAQIRVFRDRGLPRLRVAVNLSPVQLQQDCIVELIREILREYELPPSALELEITEGAIMKDVDRVAAVLNELHQMGLTLSVDDFGVGYFSLSYLRRFPIDTLKIDQSFMRDIKEDASNRSIVKAMITMAHALDMDVVAEGVETDVQLQLLRELGCDRIQGYLLARPMSADQLITFLTSAF